MTGLPTNRIVHGDCVDVMRGLPAESVDFVLTDPPYGVRYRDRAGRTVVNDDRLDWLRPAFAEMFRLLKPGSFAVSFYGWNQVDHFVQTWRSVGFTVVGHLVFRKRYASSTRYLAYHHESAFLLAKGPAMPPAEPLPDVLDWTYTGNRLHPTQKPVESLVPLVRSFCPPGGIVIDPFCGSGSSLVAAWDGGCRYIGIELDARHHRTASARLGRAAPQPEEERHPTPWLQPFTRYVTLPAS